MTAIDEIRDQLDLLPVPAFFGVSFCAAKIGVTGAYLRNHAELLPKHGVSEVPGKRLWSLRTIREWLAATPAQHAEDWAKLPPAVRSAIVSKR